MNILRRAILTFALIAGITPAIAQVPPPVPGLPDSERRTSYSISASTCVCTVNFAIYGDSTDYANWIEVWLNGVIMPAAGNWTITSPSGPLATIPRPITDAVLTFTAAQTGTVQIVGARRPRRTSQFNENTGVPARNVNQVITDITATLRELWDKTNDMTGRGVFAPPGETLNTLPPMASRASHGVCFDSGGSLTSCVSVPSSTFSAGSGVTFTGTNPTTISVPTYTAGNGISFTGTVPTTITNNIQAGAGIAITGTNPLVIASTSGRTRLTSPLTLFVDNALGNDANLCLTAGAGACRTIQHTVNHVCGDFDLNAQHVTIQLTLGQSYLEGVNLCNYMTGLNDTAGAPTILGDPTSLTTLQNYVINGQGGIAVVGVGVTTPWVLNGLTLVSVGGTDLEADFQSYIYAKNVGFSAAQNHVQSLYNSSVEFVGNIYILTGAAAFLNGSTGGKILMRPGFTIAISNAQNFTSAFMNASTNALIELSGVTYTGTATGNQCSGALGAGIDTGGALSSIPGTASTCNVTTPGWKN